MLGCIAMGLESLPERRTVEATQAREGGVHAMPVVIAINIAVYVLMLKVGGAGELTNGFSERTLCLFGANYGPFIARDLQLFRLVTSMFIHMSALHLLLNMTALWSVGRWLEPRWGAWRFVVLYFVSGIAGSGASLAYHVRSPVISAGASGAICGLIAAAAVLAHRVGPSAQSMRNAMVRWAIATIAYGVVIHADNAAHAGGLVVGALLGLWFGVPRRAAPAPFAPIVALLAVCGVVFVQAARARDRAEPPSSLIGRAVDLAKGGHDDEAIALYRRAIELEPQEPIGHYDLGLALSRRGDFDGAEDALEAALRLGPDPDRQRALAAVHVNHGVALAHQQRFDDAVGHYRRALEIDPRDVTALYDMGISLRDKGDVDAAEVALRRALALDTKSEARAELAALLVNRAVSRARAEHLDEAIVEYQEALSLEPDDPIANFDLSLALERRGDHQGALAAVEKSLAAEPSRRATRHLAFVLTRVGRPREAAAALDKIASLPAEDD